MKKASLYVSRRWSYYFSSENRILCQDGKMLCPRESEDIWEILNVYFYVYIITSKNLFKPLSFNLLKNITFLTGWLLMQCLQCWWWLWCVLFQQILLKVRISSVINFSKWHRAAKNKHIFWSQTPVFVKCVIQSEPRYYEFHSRIYFR